jgi:hypothetical protein
VEDDEEDESWFQFATPDDLSTADQLQQIADEYNTRAAEEHHALGSSKNLEVDDSVDPRFSMLQIDAYNLVRLSQDVELWMFRVLVRVKVASNLNLFLTTFHQVAHNFAGCISGTYTIAREDQLQLLSNSQTQSHWQTGSSHKRTLEGLYRICQCAQLRS